MDPIVHFEIPTDDMSRAEKFYQEAFDWKTENWQDKYTMAYTAEIDPATHAPKEIGKINGGLLMRKAVTPTPVLTLQVASIEEAVKKIEAAGGKVTRGKEAIGEMGFAAYFQDSEGNILGLFEYAKQA